MAEKIQIIIGLPDIFKGFETQILCIFYAESKTSLSFFL